MQLLDLDAKGVQVLGNMALVSASTNLQLRAYVLVSMSCPVRGKLKTATLPSVALWKGNTPVRTLLVVLCLAHWVFCIERECPFVRMPT